MNSFEEQENYLVGNFEFTNFTKALAFVNQCGELFEQHNHHPDIGIYDYRMVNVATTTHDAGHVVTDKDKEMVKKIEELYITNFDTD